MCKCEKHDRKYVHLGELQSGNFLNSITPTHSHDFVENIKYAFQYILMSMNFIFIITSKS